MNQDPLPKDEEAIVKLAQQGNDEAFREITNRYKTLIRAKARIYFIAGGDRDDMIQEGMIGLFKAVKDYDETKESSFRSFAELCVIRQMITAVKTASRQKHIPLNSYISFSKPIYNENEDKTYADSLMMKDDKNPEDMIIIQEETKNLERSIRKILSRMETRVFEYYLKGLSYTEIAEKMGKSPKSIDNALSRIRKKAESI